MSEPLDAIGLPTTTILKPANVAYSDTSNFMEVTAGPSRSSTTIHVPIGVSLISVDFNFSSGRAGLRLLKNGLVTFPIPHVARGTETHLVRIVNDDPTAWIAIQSSRIDGGSAANAGSRAAVTIYPILAV